MPDPLPKPTPEQRAEAISKIPPLTERRFTKLQSILHKTKYPILFADLVERLGGRNAIYWCCDVSTSRGGISYTEDYFAISDPRSENGVYQIIFEFNKTSNDRGKDMVVAARLCFVAPFGAQFFAKDEDLYLL